MTANKERGEVEVLLNGKTHLLRPSMEAHVKIEADLGMGMVSVARSLIERAYTLNTLAVLLQHSVVVEVGSPKPTQALAAKELFKAGIISPEVFSPFLALVMNFLNGGVEPKEEEAGAGKIQSPSADI